MKNTNFFPLERNHYFYGKLLTVRDFEQEQKYFNDKRRLLNRMLHGAGVVCGLSVVKSDDTTLVVESGMALDYYGREIVLPAPDINSLAMLDGYDSILGRSQAFLCLRYDEEMKESVNAVGAESGKGAENNKFAESYKLYLDVEDPDIPSLIDSGAFTNSTMLYQADGIWIALTQPKAVAASDEFAVECLVVKGAEHLPISFKLEFESEYITDSMENHNINLEFAESPQQMEEIYRLHFKLAATNVENMLTKLSEKNAKFSIRIGDVNQDSEIPLDKDIFICKDSVSVPEFLQQQETLASRWSGDYPIYLAKLDLIPSPATALIRDVVCLPFGQRIHNEHEPHTVTSASGKMQVETKVEVLKYWQKPEVQAKYNEASSTLQFAFALPSNEANDYATTSGVVDIPFADGMRVNGRYYSKEISHNLGTGNVSLNLAVEFGDGGDQGLLFGNGEVFRAKNGDKSVPQIELGAVLYPERGTFKIGVWLMDSVESAGIRIRYFAAKVTNDLKEMKKKNAISIKIVPEIQRMKIRESVHLKALVTGSADKGIAWEVKDKNGGSIDKQGIYNAPDMPGTYEVIATSTADTSRSISAFVIVEE